MIGKPEWFTRRKYGGWGLFPTKWQGWLYILIALGFLFSIQYLVVDSTTRLIATGVWALLFIVDFIDLMFHLKNDEREKIHEAIAERNALWVIVLALAIAVGYQIASSTSRGHTQFDYWILIAIGLGLVAKATTNIYLDRKD